MYNECERRLSFALKKWKIETFSSPIFIQEKSGPQLAELCETLLLGQILYLDWGELKMPRQVFVFNQLLGPGVSYITLLCPVTVQDQRRILTARREKPSTLPLVRNAGHG